MSLFGRSAAAEPGVSLSVIARPLALVPRVEKATDAYSEIASEIGLESPALTKNKVMAWLSENNVKVYNGTQVYEYLAVQLSGFGSITWRPLRERDYSGARWYWGNTSSSLSRGRNREINVRMSGPVYAMAIPLHAVRLVRDMESTLGKESMSFFVSDVMKREEERLDDPFLAVSPRNDLSDITIIDMWDEPGFGK